MSDAEITLATTPSGHSRRSFIKGVIATGAAVSSSHYLFRAPGALSATSSVKATMPRMITLDVNGASRSVDVLPQETLP